MRSANYIEETTTSIAGTLGDGAVTLTARTNRPRVSTMLTTTYVGHYVIEDTVNKKFETGIGNWASNVLTRTKPLSTWDGTTYVNTGTVAAIQFGSTPTAGNVIIRVGDTAETRAVLFDGRNTTIAGDTDWRDYPFSGHYQLASGTGGTGNLVADKEYYSYYKLEQGGNLAGVQFKVITAVAASNLKWALYDIGTNGLPNNKIVDFVTTATTTTGAKTDTATGSWTPATGVNLTPGWYAFGFISGHAIALACNNSSSNAVGLTPLGRKSSYGNGNTVSVAGSYATGLPAVANLTGGAITDPGTASAPHAMWMGMKVT